MNQTSESPLFIAEEVICAYPISTFYDSCPRYLFYALLLATCITRWTDWLADVFLGAAATYAGTAAIQAFILVSSPPKQPPSEPITIPYIPSNTTLWNTFPALITSIDQLNLTPAALDLDADAVLAIVVTAYLTFLPLQCWSRAISQERARYILFSLWHILMLAGSICALIYWPTLHNTPTQYTFCFPDLAPTTTSISSDGWEPRTRTSTWNTSIWDIFTNETLFNQLPSICYYPCFNTSQVLRQPTSLEAVIVSGDYRVHQRSRFWDEVVYSQRYIYSLIVLTMIVNVSLLLFKILPYHSRLPSSQVRTIWSERKTILNGLKTDFCSTIHLSRLHRTTVIEKTRQQLSIWKPALPLFNLQAAGLWIRLLLDTAILCTLVFSIIVSPLTVIAFVVWIEYYIHEDGPSQETPRQVGQWAPLASIAFLVVSAAVLKVRYWVASGEELEEEIAWLRGEVERLERIRARGGMQ
ncbi:integral membrane protein [Aspergillus sclerotioniger CBS 115572]|uniref:Integral membrane protein n=1 Tax=Aspergillus sclerotioniger CBS 115572 TaxID=1450535 RepID=A0A317V7M2_9EURO|nr:integral membrane protein [Aspergillus sclerotioniger CBS 115572]PWY68967.1 integral membrane protein [Aspergillus sclerotioniger CBS 115572]